MTTSLIRRATTICACLLGLTNCATAATYRVGSGQVYATLAALPALRPGDIVELTAGTHNEVRRWTANGTVDRPITIRGVGATRPIVDATGKNVGGSLPNPRAAFQIEGSHYVVEHLEFRNAHNGNNGAGIRVTGVGVTDTLIRDVKITNNDMGLMSDGNDLLVVESSELAFNGTAGNGYQHNVYIGRAQRTTFRFCWIHDAVDGINFKSRGHYTELLYSLVADGGDAEVSLVNDPTTATAHSNALLLGNVIVSKVRGTNNNPTKFIDFGQDTGGSHNGTLYLVNNTLVAGTPSIEFLWSSAADSRIEATNNIFWGSNQIVSTNSAFHPASISGQTNWIGQTAAAPAGFTGSVSSATPGFVDASARDYHLTDTAAVINRGLRPLSVDGSGLSIDATPHFEPSGPARASIGALDLGAYEFGVSGTTVAVRDAAGNAGGATFTFTVR